MKQDFIILTQPRSGDEILISQLRSHPNIYITLGKPLRDFAQQTDFSTLENFLHSKFKTQNYEIKYREQDIMHSLNTREFMEEYYNTYFKLVNASIEEQAAVKEFLDNIYSKDKVLREEGHKAATEYAYCRYRSSGYTAYIEDIFVTDTLSKLIEQNSKLKIILLTRKNLLFRYTSQQLPVETNEHGYTKITADKVCIDKQKLHEDISYRQQEQQVIKEQLNISGIDYIEIVYEDLIKNNRVILDKVQTFLNVPIQEKDLFGINVNNIFEETRPLEVIIDNYNQLKAECYDLQNYFEMAEKSANPFYYEIRKAGTFASLEFLREMVDGMDKNLHDPYTNKQVINSYSALTSGGAIDY